MTCTSCQTSAAPFELREGKCLDCIYREYKVLQTRHQAAVEVLHQVCAGMDCVHFSVALPHGVAELAAQIKAWRQKLMAYSQEAQPVNSAQA